MRLRRMLVLAAHLLAAACLAGDCVDGSCSPLPDGGSPKAPALSMPDIGSVFGAAIRQEASRMAEERMRPRDPGAPPPRRIDCPRCGAFFFDRRHACGKPLSVNGGKLEIDWSMDHD